MSDQDDQQRGTLLSRREALRLFGAAYATMLAACVPAALGTSAPTSAPTQGVTGTAALVSATDTTASGLPACVVRPELTEGPYFVDEKLDRSDIRSDPSDGTVKEGAPLELVFRVSQIDASACRPLAGATVDVWHCDALGVYSDVSDPGFNTVGQKFLRGYQVTGADGVARFTTIYPGWYQGRTVHIHFKIRTGAGLGSTYEFTSQLFFDDGLSDRVHARMPYAQKGQRTLRNAGDGIFQQSGGQLTLDVVEAAEGYTTTFDIGLDLT